MDRRVPSSSRSIRRAAPSDRFIPWLVGPAVVLVSLWQWGPTPDALLRGISLGLITAFLVWAALRRRRQRDTAIREELLARRLEIARDLHDTVASRVAAIGLQAAAAGRVLERDPVAARGALTQVEEAARGANADLRRMLEALRSPDDALSAAPEASLADLPALVDEFHHAGLDVDLTMDPSVSAVALDPAVGQAAYRVVQEALTNAVRHAAGAHVEADVHVVDSTVLIRVSNSDGRPDDAGAGPGFGLRGMRERVTVFGGSLDAGPTDGGGFEVRARLPIADGAPR